MLRSLSLMAVLGLLVIIANPAAAQTWSQSTDESPALVGFGGAFAISGNEILATRTGESMLFPEPPAQTGSVHVYHNTDDGWVEKTEIVPSAVNFGDRFGHQMSLTGDVLAVTGPGAADYAGALWIFERGEDGSWVESARLTASDATATDSLGWSVAAGLDVVFVGAPGVKSGTGAVYAFSRSGDGSWTQSAKLTGSAADSVDNFGRAIAFNGDLLLVGTPKADNGSGVVYMFAKDPASDSWSETGLVHSIDSSATGFGGAIAATPDRVLISALGSQSTPGVISAFGKNEPGEWVKQGVLASPDTTTGQRGVSSSFYYGAALTIAGDNAWVGVPLGGGESSSGQVDVYHFSDGAWNRTHVLVPEALAAFAGYGSRIAASNDVAVIGAPRADFGDGRAWVYEYNAETSDWTLSNTIVDSGSNLEALTGEEIKCEEGEAGPFTCKGVDLLSYLPVRDVGGERGVIVNDVWGWTDPETGAEIVILGRSNGTSFLDVSNPGNPLYLGDLPMTEGSAANAWRDVKVYNDHAFIVADNVGEHGMQVFDLTLLRAVESPPEQFEATALYDNIHSAHNVVINEETGYAYIVGGSWGGETCGGSLHMVDIRDPANPKFAGCHTDSTEGRLGIHDSQCITYSGPDQNYAGKELCFNSSQSVFTITDMTDKENPLTIASSGYPSVAYVHQGWLSEDQKHFFLNDEGDEVGGLVEGTRTVVWDVSDLEDPVVVKEYVHDNQASDHNLYVKDNLMYQSNYVSGLRVLDVSDPENPHEVGFFDTVPWGADAPGFAGSWSNYPYFESGTIVVTSIREGMFLVKKSEELVP